jgi:hypothetical protein
MQRQQSKNIAEKLHAIQSIISGSLSFEHLQPPKEFVVFHDGEYYLLDDKQMTEAQYEAWLLTLRLIDSVILFKEQRAYPVGTETPIADVVDNLPVHTIPARIEAIKEPVIKPKKKKYIEAEETHLIVVKARSGRLSEFGESWDFADSSIYQNSKN